MNNLLKKFIFFKTKFKKKIIYTRTSKLVGGKYKKYSTMLW